MLNNLGRALLDLGCGQEVGRRLREALELNASIWRLQRRPRAETAS